MIFAAAVALALLTSWTWRLWRAVLERETRWKLYALRDELRWLAIEDPALLQNKAFWLIDESLTRDARMLESVSLWMLVPAMVARSRMPQDSGQDAAKSIAAHPITARIYKESVNLFVGHLVRRHAMLLGIASIFFAIGTAFGAIKATASPAQRAAERLFMMPPSNGSPA